MNKLAPFASHCKGVDVVCGPQTHHGDGRRKNLHILDVSIRGVYP